MTGALHAGLFIDMLASERGASRNTLDAYRRDLADYLAYLSEIGSAPDRAEASALRGFMGSLEERGLKASSAARRLSAVRQFHKFLYVEGYAPVDPTAAISAPKRGRVLPKVLSVEQVDRLLSVAQEAATRPDDAPALRLRRSGWSACLSFSTPPVFGSPNSSPCHAAPQKRANDFSWCAARAPRSAWCP